MRKIHNPYVGIPGYNCFGCAPHNIHGLRMEFFEEGDEIISHWNPENHFQGFGEILHGGILATLMDESAGWTVFIKLKTSGVTSKMEVDYRRPVKLNAGPISIRSKLTEMNGNIAIIDSKLFNASGTLCCESRLHYFTFSEEKAREKLRYPGIDAFFETENK